MTTDQNKSFVPCGPGWSVHIRGRVELEDGSIQVQDSYWPVVGWMVSFPEDTGEEIEPVFHDPTIPDTASLSAWTKVFKSPTEQFLGVVPTRIGA